MTPPPPTLRGHAVLQYAVIRPHLSPTGMTRHLVDGKFMSPIEALAICASAEEGVWYLFYCDESWGVLAHSEHPSAEAARQQAEFEGDDVFLNWQSPQPREPDAGDPE